jgi:hypothetical protein
MFEAMVEPEKEEINGQFGILLHHKERITQYCYDGEIWDVTTHSLCNEDARGDKECVHK